MSSRQVIDTSMRWRGSSGVLLTTVVLTKIYSVVDTLCILVAPYGETERVEVRVVALKPFGGIRMFAAGAFLARIERLSSQRTGARKRGKLFLSCGPSGAGKDTCLSGAQAGADCVPCHYFRVPHSTPYHDWCIRAPPSHHCHAHHNTAHRSSRTHAHLAPPYTTAAKALPYYAYMHHASSRQAPPCTTTVKAHSLKPHPIRSSPRSHQP